MEGKKHRGSGRHIGALVFASEGTSQYAVFGYGNLIVLDACDQSCLLTRPYKKLRMPTRSRDATLGTNTPRCLHASILSAGRTDDVDQRDLQFSNRERPTTVPNRSIGMVSAEEHLGRLAGLFLRRCQEKVGPGVLSQYGVKPLEFAVHFDDNHSRGLMAV